MHYHGTPITPAPVLAQLVGRNFCVSYADPRDVAVCHEIGQSVMLDNGAFTHWRQDTIPDWDGYHAWCEPWLERHTTWAVIPDVIDGDEADNDLLIGRWPHGSTKGAPVWHMHESVDRLLDLCEEFPRVCVGSSGAYRFVGSDPWHRRMEQAFNALCPTGPPPVWLHMLRGMALSEGPYPFASVDSTDIARNHNRNGGNALVMADRWDGRQTPARWTIVDQLSMEIA
jgi:hypothetical protein